jgi:putative spermidine/putrescine transport system permease protein
MADSSAPDAPDDELARAALEEVEEAESMIGVPREAALGRTAADGRKGGGWVTALLAAPGFVWLAFFLIAPLVFIVLVSFWTRTDTGFVRHWTTANYTELFHDSTYWHNMLTSFETSLIAVVVCLILGFPVAYFLAMKVVNIKYQIALFVLALAPFWTSFLIRAVAWTYPVMGREGALNQVLMKLHVVSEPVSQFGFSTLSVRVAMVQLYILFMITPLFFMLAQVDRHSLESARDLGANSVKTFFEVILPQTMPGIVIGSIFIFVLTMGEYGTVRVIGSGNVTSIGTIVETKTESIQYPQAAASAVILVAVLIAGVFAITRFSNLREDI